MRYDIRQPDAHGHLRGSVEADTAFAAAQKAVAMFFNADMAVRETGTVGLSGVFSARQSLDEEPTVRFWVGVSVSGSPLHEPAHGYTGSVGTVGPDGK